MNRTLLVIFIIFLGEQAHPQESALELKVIDEYHNPIEGVYVKVNNEFAISNKYGVLSIPTKTYTDEDSISFSHLGYVSEKHAINDLKRGYNYPTLTLKSNIRELDKVVVTNMTAKDYMEKAIKSLPNNFGLEFNPSAYFNTTISFINNDDSSRLIDYKGGLVFRLDDKKSCLLVKFLNMNML